MLGHGTARALLGSPKVVGVDGSGRVDLRKGSSRRLMAETGRSSRRLSLVSQRWSIPSARNRMGSRVVWSVRYAL
eukprot:2192985-Rhodomonas_salina.1